MGKLVRYLGILIFADLLFIATGQVCARDTCTLTSIIFNAMFNVGQMTFTQFFSELIGDIINLANSTTGLLALLGSGAVLIGAFVATKEFRILLIPITLTFALIVADFIVITAYLISLSPVLASFIMIPLSILYVITVIEWWVGKD